MNESSETDGYQGVGPPGDPAGAAVIEYRHRYDMRTRRLEVWGDAKPFGPSQGMHLDVLLAHDVCPCAECLSELAGKIAYGHHEYVSRWLAGGPDGGPR